MQRRPIAQKCGPVLELSSTYRNFCKLREEFQNVLTGMSLFWWSFDFAWLKDWLTWLINYFVWVVLLDIWGVNLTRKRFLVKRLLYWFEKRLTYVETYLIETMTLIWKASLFFWTHKVKVLWNTLRLFVRFWSFFPELLIRVFWLFLHFDGVELFGKKFSSFFYQRVHWTQNHVFLLRVFLWNYSLKFLI